MKQDRMARPKREELSPVQDPEESDKDGGGGRTGKEDLVRKKNK